MDSDVQLRLKVSPGESSPSWLPSAELFSPRVQEGEAGILPLRPKGQGDKTSGTQEAKQSKVGC